MDVMDQTALFIEQPGSREKHIDGQLSILRMPYNYQRATVREVVEGFLLRSEQPYIVTGYTSLKQLVQFLARITSDKADIRLMLGNEPSPSSPHAFRVSKQDFPREIEAYWLKQRFSLRQSLDVVTALQRFENGQVEAQYLDVPGRMLHAKIYLAESNAMIGSSNFSANGLEKNIEGNVCFNRTHSDEESERYKEVKCFAEWLWEHDDAIEYTDELKGLLDKLLRPVSWKESLARACAELLEGRWADEYIEATLPVSHTTIWPSQRKGVAQALCILDQLGSVLLADATGSGKTRLGAILLRAMHDRVWKKGRARSSAFTTLVCPPGVKEHWQVESARQGLQVTPFSQGVLSNTKSQTLSGMLDTHLKQSQILCVDEAHNFLNEASNRTRYLLRNMADHVILQTATPINKSAGDLLSLINILGPDNFDPDNIKEFNRYLSRSNRDPALREEQLLKLRKEIARFSIRRTKSDFNGMIAENPEAYKDEHGHACRYPHHRAHAYSTRESDRAIEIALKVRALAYRLQGVGFVQNKIAVRAELLDTYSAEEQVQWRLAMARAASVYQIMAHLRSSRAALLKHILGAEGRGQRNKGKKDQGMIKQLQSMAGKAPQCSVHDHSVPAWIHISAAHSEAAKADSAIYQKIADLVAAMDSSREQSKARLLLQLIHSGEHQRVLAFDRHPATLIDLKQRIEAIDGSIEVLIGTGSTSNKLALEERLSPSAEASSEPLIVLCSDAMSEGLNFQRCSAVINLDMPSVVRLLEQRVGRIDRMNSLYEFIDVYWPQDSAAFALRSDDKLIERHGTVKNLLGSNVPLPQAFGADKAEAVDYVTVIEEYSEAYDSWEGLDDAFTPIRALIGAQGLVSHEQYTQIARHTEAIQVRLTVLDSQASNTPWGFFCVSGGQYSAPKWVLIEADQAAIETDFEVIARHLSERLSGVAEKDSAPLDTGVQSLLDGYLDRISSLEHQLLPRRKQVALKQMKAVLTRYSDVEDLSGDDRDFLMGLVKMLANSGGRMNPVDWNSVAEKWLELIRPHWHQAVSRKKKKRAVQLKDIEQSLIDEPVAIERIREQFQKIDYAPAIEDRIVACIINPAPKYLHSG